MKTTNSMSKHEKFCYENGAMRAFEESYYPVGSSVFSLGLIFASMEGVSGSGWTPENEFQERLLSWFDRLEEPDKNYFRNFSESLITDRHKEAVDWYYNSGISTSYPTPSDAHNYLLSYLSLDLKWRYPAYQLRSGGVSNRLIGGILDTGVTKAHRLRIAQVETSIADWCVTIAPYEKPMSDLDLVDHAALVLRKYLDAKKSSSSLAFYSSGISYSSNLTLLNGMKSSAVTLDAVWKKIHFSFSCLSNHTIVESLRPPFRLNKPDLDLTGPRILIFSRKNSEVPALVFQSGTQSWSGACTG